MNFVNSASCRESSWACSALVRCSIDVADAVNPFASWVSCPFLASVNEFSEFLSWVANPLVGSRKKLLTAVGFCEICCDSVAELSDNVPS